MKTSLGGEMKGPGSFCLIGGDNSVNHVLMNKNIRAISWIKAAEGFEEFPEDAQIEILRALTVAAGGRYCQTHEGIVRLKEMLR